MRETSWGLMEHNVQLVFLFTVMYWSASSIISQQVLSGYVYVLTASNTPVGFVKGIQGLTQLVCAFPAGYAADCTRRDRTLIVAGIVGVVASVLTAMAFELADMLLMYVAFGLWGAFTAFQSSAMEALFADSAPMGQRSAPFTLKYVMRNVALVLGPTSAILLLWKNGDVWTLVALRPVLLFGAFIAAVSMVLLFQFNDDLAFENRQYVFAIERELSSIERNFTSEYSDRESSASEQGVNFSRMQIPSTSEFSQLLQSSRVPSANSGYYLTAPLRSDDDEDVSVRPVMACWGMLDTAHVPYLLFVSNFLVSNGTGLVTAFFPLFFLHEYALSPIRVQTLFALQPLVMALLSFLSQMVSSTTGRMSMVVVTRVLGTISLLLMAVSHDVADQSVLFVFHGAFMQCTEPLRRSLLMDFVPKSHRARWNSLEGLTVASWAGSAVLGGIIVDAYGYRICFIAAALVYICGLALETMLIPLTRHAAETLENLKPQRAEIS
ncbi:hypothetical protein PF005_g9512 [Phytophthora fragariae]|uniref:Major facilitator superfamily (MFS) profile domain-containing protein n=1 Tax=Phytophthora fragariae TaxID=53985 RepID=A0A6A3L1Q7_9STRA|nr:hypothetical protein PF003_g32665 [Phytophthora fragariae]KAE8939842.1 hypothetical protein PF009_g10338 [Phytophthora fragariae]KAE9013512.1 hypothetical protein PF011_g8457 [Phytophthora fragariae]KAE9116629.1 hypothetical protein PF007_g9595 [Phytophthora fragariae]KAE9119152.1 hypothetical protein PF010_g7971 [Phytophthora fragariae]